MMNVQRDWIKLEIKWLSPSWKQSTDSNWKETERSWCNVSMVGGKISFKFDDRVMINTENYFKFLDKIFL